jgi:hypothetical protein
MATKPPVQLGLLARHAPSPSRAYLLRAAQALSALPSRLLSLALQLLVQLVLLALLKRCQVWLQQVPQALCPPHALLPSRAYQLPEM